MIGKFSRGVFRYYSLELKYMGSIVNSWSSLSMTSKRMFWVRLMMKSITFSTFRFLARKEKIMNLGSSIRLDMYFRSVTMSRYDCIRPSSLDF